ncbi:unnamed protein product [Schistosoma mattheei]|uniref:Uncharacterized protein n=1 Tax=Schistosoma mattheei TaxID=31246 RepID=A0A3P8HSE4_9TREM|nr:unnamed protein product [Schistosoma mattheei]
MFVSQNHLDDTTYILLRFTRHPELIEIGRQFILTWNGNLKTIGYAVELIDPLKHHYNLSLNTLSNNNTTTSTSTTNVQDPICWNNNIQQNSVSFQENDHYDWSSLRQSFINRTISMNNYPFGSIDNLHTSSNLLLLSSSLPSTNMEFYGHLTNNESCKRSATTTTSSNSLIPVNHLTSLSQLVQNHDIDIDDNINHNSNNNNNSTDIDHSTQSIIDINNVKQFSESSISSSGGVVTTFTPSSSSSSKNNKRRHRRKQKR